MSIPAELMNRYRMGGRIAYGGMGEVYRADDIRMETEVAIKILPPNATRQALELFDKEWRILRDLHHGNIVSILDRGEFPDGNVTRPFFVMPYLKGKTLHDLIYESEKPLPVADVIGMICKVCDGIAAAHTKGVIHRDLKPSNIYVLEGGSIQIIDFGVSHVADHTRLTTIKGTFGYIAPELLDPSSNKSPSRLTDLFSLGVVTYEALTRVQPFERGTDQQTERAVRFENPRPALEHNAEVGMSISQVVHKCMAKSDLHRYASASEFAEKLQRALRNEPLPEFDPSTLDVRIAAVQAEFDAGNMETANTLLQNIEAEGWVHLGVSRARFKIDNALEQKRINQKIELARAQRGAAGIAILDEILDEQPQHTSAAALRRQIVAEIVGTSLEGCERELRRQNYRKAREILGDAQKLRPRDTRILERITRLERLEERSQRLLREKETLFAEAQKAYKDGELTHALEKLERILQIQEESATEPTDRDREYQEFLRDVREEDERVRHTFAECRGLVEAGKYHQAAAICEQMLNSRPGHPLFAAAMLDIRERERQVRLDYITELRRQAECVADLESRVTLLQEAEKLYPAETQIQELVRNAKSRRDQFATAIAYARKTEERNEFGEALERWQLVRMLHPAFKGVEEEIRRISRRREEQVQLDRKNRQIRCIEEMLSDGDFGRALATCEELLRDSPDDKQLLILAEQVRVSAARAREAAELLSVGQMLLEEHRIEEAIDSLRRALVLDGRNEPVRQMLGAALVEKARRIVDTAGARDWKIAQPVIAEALGLRAHDADAQSLADRIAAFREADLVEDACMAAFRLAAEPVRALEIIDAALKEFPRNTRLHEERRNLAAVLGPQAPPLPLIENGSKTGPPLTTPPPAREETRIFSEEEALRESDVAPSPVEAPARRPWRDYLESWAEVAGRRGRALKDAGVPKLQQAWEATRKTQQSLLVPVRLRYMAIGGGALAGLLIVLAISRDRNPRTSADDKSIAPSAIQVTLAVSPAAADLWIDGQPAGKSAGTVDLRPGPHKFSIKAAGYLPAEREVTVSEDNRRLNLTLQPIPLILRVRSDQSGQDVLVGNTPAGRTNPGEFVSMELAPGTHAIRIGAATLDVSFEPGRAPVVNTPAADTDLAALVVAASGADVQIRSNVRTGKILVDDTAIDDAAAAESGIRLPPGKHTIALEKTPASAITIEPEERPQLLAVLWGAKPKLTIPERLRDVERLWNAERFPDALAIVNGILREAPQYKGAANWRAKLVRAIELSGGHVSQ